MIISFEGLSLRADAGTGGSAGQVDQSYAESSA